MNCLIIAATPIEIAPFIRALQKVKVTSKKWEVDVLITGIGLLATSYTLQKQLQLKRPDWGKWCSLKKKLLQTKVSLS